MLDSRTDVWYRICIGRGAELPPLRFAFGADVIAVEGRVMKNRYGTRDVDFAVPPSLIPCVERAAGVLQLEHESWTRARSADVRVLLRHASKHLPQRYEFSSRRLQR